MTELSDEFATLASTAGACDSVATAVDEFACTLARLAGSRRLEVSLPQLASMFAVLDSLRADGLAIAAEAERALQLLPVVARGQLEDLTRAEITDWLRTAADHARGFDDVLTLGRS